VEACQIMIRNGHKDKAIAYVVSRDVGKIGRETVRKIRRGKR
jgi:hypothetical protein